MHATWAEAAYAGLTLLLGYTVLGLSGFGSALVIIPLLAWHWPLTLIVPLVLLIDVPASLLHTGLNLRRVVWREIPRLIPTIAAGALSGALLLRHVHGQWPLLLLGAYLVAVGLRGLRAGAPPASANASGSAGAWPAGFAMGCIEIMFGTAGPVVVAWLSRRLPDPLALRATVPVAIVVVASIALAGAAMNGQMGGRQLWIAWAFLMPLSILGVLAGHRIASHLSPQRVRMLVYGLLSVSGLAMLVRTALAL